MNQTAFAEQDSIQASVAFLAAWLTQSSLAPELMPPISTWRDPEQHGFGHNKMASAGPRHSARVTIR